MINNSSKKLSIISGHAYNSRSHSLIDGTDGVETEERAAPLWSTAPGGDAVCALLYLCVLHQNGGGRGLYSPQRNKNYQTRYKRLEFCDVQILSDLYQSDPTGPT